MEYYNKDKGNSLIPVDYPPLCLIYIFLLLQITNGGLNIKRGD
jgi:hypothetical protein